MHMSIFEIYRKCSHTTDHRQYVASINMQCIDVCVRSVLLNFTYESNVFIRRSFSLLVILIICEWQFFDEEWGRGAELVYINFFFSTNRIFVNILHVEGDERWSRQRFKGLMLNKNKNNIYLFISVFTFSLRINFSCPLQFIWNVILRASCASGAGGTFFGVYVEYVVYYAAGF